MEDYIDRLEAENQELRETCQKLKKDNDLLSEEVRILKGGTNQPNHDALMSEANEQIAQMSREAKEIMAKEMQREKRELSRKLRAKLRRQAIDDANSNSGVVYGSLSNVSPRLIDSLVNKKGRADNKARAYNSEVSNITNTGGVHGQMQEYFTGMMGYADPY